jgi:hypothetical protein
VPIVGKRESEFRRWAEAPQKGYYQWKDAYHVLQVAAYRHQAEYPVQYGYKDGVPVPTSLTEDFDEIEIDVDMLRDEARDMEGQRAEAQIVEMQSTVEVES